MSNGTATIKVTTEAGHNGTATLYTRSAAGAWQAWGSPIAISNGSGSTKVKLTASRTFKVTADVGGTSAIFSIAMEDSSRRALTASFSSPDYLYGELVWIRGTVYRNGSAYAGAPLTVQRARIGSSTWTTVGKAKSSSNGGYTYKINPLTTYRYRVTLGTTLGRMRVALIKPKVVIFSIEEFGLNRQDSLVLGDTTRVRGR